MILDFCDGDAESTAGSVDEASNDLSLIFEGLGTFDPKENAGGGNDHAGF